MNTYERITIRAALVLVALSFLLVAFLVPSLPDQVPVHFNAGGHPNRIGSRYELIALPFVQLIVVSIFWAIRHTNPDVYNLPPAQSVEHRTRMVQNTRSMMATIALIVSVFMTWLSYTILQAGQGSSMVAAWFPMALLLISLLGTIGVFTFRTHLIR